MNDQIEILRDVARRLDDLGVPYMLTGSLALNYYAEPRMTRDIDLVVEISAADAARLSSGFSDDYYVSEDAVLRAASEHGVFNLIHSKLIVKVDFIVRKDTEYRRLEFSRRRIINVQGVQVAAVSPEDLLLSKLEWSRGGLSDVQMRDASSLAASVKDLDRRYLQEWAARLGLSDLLERVGL